MKRLAAALFLGMALASGPAGAQQTTPTAGPVSQILVLDIEAVFNDSLYGKRVLDDYNATAVDLEAENRRIADSLLAEERDLTERRPTMDPAAFRQAAAEFDTRVQGIRHAQDAKERELQSMVAKGREAFAQAMEPVLISLLRDLGAVVILDARTTIARLDAIDVTARAVEAADRMLGDGADAAAN